MKKAIFVFNIIFVFIFSNCLIFDKDIYADSNIVAVVNDQKLTRNDLANLLIESFGKEGIDLLIKRTLVRQEAKKLKVKINEKEITERINVVIDSEIRRQIKKGGMKDEKDLERELEKKGLTIEQYRKNIIRAFKLTNSQIEAELLAERIIKKTIEITDEDLHEAYEVRYGEKIIARQIVSRTKRDATRIHEKIGAGADFKALVKKESIDRSSASRGGEMRPFGPHGTLGKAVANLKKGGVSEIIKTDAGYHILKLEKRIPKSSKKFSEVKDELVKLVTALKVQKRVGPWLLNLAESSEITKNLPD